MKIELRFFATFRESVGQKVIEREFEESASTGDVLRTIQAEYPDMELFDDDGSLHQFVRPLRNGKQIEHLDGLDTKLEDGDALSVFPPVAGG